VRASEPCSWGDTLTLTAAIAPQNADIQKVTWSSNNPAIAAVNDDGVVSGVSVGSTTITATAIDGGFVARVNITVVEAPQYALQPPALSPDPTDPAATTGTTVPVDPDAPVQPSDLWTPGFTPSSVPLTFDDVDENAWYFESVNKVASAGLFVGTQYGNFEPNAQMTRAMFAQVLANLDGANTADFAELLGSFRDVLPNAWYFEAVEWAASHGIITGFGDGNFAPNNAINREQMAAMLFRFINVMGIELPVSHTIVQFTDQSSISSWAVEDVAAMQAIGLITGRPDGSFDPQATASRAEVATIFARFLALIE